tara:strand:+ start:1427 stop:1819 length:393 start_codon:yes stop_codon:yes gene_type:complete
LTDKSRQKIKVEFSDHLKKRATPKSLISRTKKIKIMKTDFYTKTVLTVIAFCLSILVMKDLDIIPKAYANENNNSLSANINYGLVPLNPDGSIDVNIKSNSDIISVNIEEVGGWSTFGKVPVVIKENEDK